MAEDSAVAAQIVRLLRQHPPAVWELIDITTPARAEDVVLRDAEGAPIAYARPAARGSQERSQPLRGV
jgi:hypothetical protein